MPERETQFDPIEGLADEFIDRRRRGESVSITEYVLKHPDLADEIRELFPTIAVLENLKVEKHQFSSGRASLGGAQIERLGDFRILREIGRGGMGIVYEAEQESLKRHVAIKILPRHSLMKADYVKRFRREASIAGRLHHTNIVSVFGVGEDDGYHYYVMQLVCGVGMDRLIEHLAQGKIKPAPLASHPSTSEGSDPPPAPTMPRVGVGSNLPLKNMETRTFAGGSTDAEKLGAPCDLPKPVLSDPSPQVVSLEAVAAVVGGQYDRKRWTNIARMAIQVANALQCAHEQGTLHCDIKPANLLVDEQGTVLITDFGVAKAMQAEKVTRTGDVTGTLLYIAPERFAGKTDARSDVYSLGLVLYELLTLQTAFGESDRQSLMRQILEAAPAPPRKVDPQVPRDLETIVLKAIARDPEHRYASARTLAEDLQRLIDDRPILARRATVAERLWRWRRRNPALASLTSAVAVLLMLVAGVAIAGYVQTAHANRLIHQALEGETQQRKKAESNTTLAVSVLDQIYSRLAPRRSTRIGGLTMTDSKGEQIEVPLHPAISKETATLLENLLGFYDRLAGEGDQGQDLRKEIALANHRVADIKAQLGQYDQARKAYYRTLALYEPLLSQADDKTALQTEIAGLHNDLASLDHRTGDLDAARGELRKATEILSPLASKPAAPEGARYELAQTYYDLGTLTRAGRGPEGPLPGEDRLPRGDSRDKGPPPRDGPRDEGPPDDDPNLPPRDFPPPGPPGPDGRPLPRPVFGFGPPRRKNGPLRSEPGGSPAREMQGPHPSAQPIDPEERRIEKEYLGKAIDLLLPLNEARPAIGVYRRLLACCYRERSQMEDDQEKSAAQMDQSVKLLDQLVKDYPDVSDFRCELAETHCLFAVEPDFADPQRRKVAEKHLQTALELAGNLTRENPTAPEYAAVQVRTLHKLAGVRFESGRYEEGLDCLRKAQVLQASLVARFPQDKSQQLWLVIIDRALVDSLRQGGQFQEARTILESDLATLARLTQGAAMPPHLRDLMGDTYEDLADVYAHLGELKKEGEAREKARQERGE